MTNKSNTDCKQGLCRYDSASRTKFSNGMLLTDEHLYAEQQYHRNALRRLNRYLWGSGIVCGFKVECVAGLCVKVHPGFALDCCGNSIESCEPLTLDLADVCTKVFEGCAPKEAEPVTKCLMLRYHEIAADSISSSPPDDDCGGAGKSQVQASRVREGFCLEVCSNCPTTTCQQQREQMSALLFDSIVYETVLTREKREGTEDECMAKTPACPPCQCECDECGICLATLSIDCVKRQVTVYGDCRRYVLGPRQLQALAEMAASSANKDPVFYRFKTQAAQWLRPAEPATEKKSAKDRKSSDSVSTKE